MKKTVAIILLMIILFSMITNVVSAEPGTINTTTVRMRREANTSSDVLQLVGLGTEVEVLGEENGWYRVEYNGLMLTDIQIESTGDMASFNASVTNDLGKDIEGHLIYLNFLREDGTVIDKVETYFPEIIDGETGYISATTPKDIATAYSLNITEKIEN